MRRTDEGLVPETDGWFVLNAAEARWFDDGPLGHFTPFAGDVRFERAGFSIAVLEPGQPNGLYHREDDQEDFLVLSGECLLLVEGEERPLGPGTSCTARPARSTSSSAPVTGRACSCSRALAPRGQRSSIRGQSSRRATARARTLRPTTRTRRTSASLRPSPPVPEGLVAGGVVGAAGFEPAISSPQKRRGTRLRYAPRARVATPTLSPVF